MKLKPYCAGFLAMTIAARIIGTYSRVSRGSQRLLELSSQKSSLPVRFIARCTRPGPPLYDASARCQSPSKMRLSVFRYFAAAFVAFSGSDRSSMYQSCLRPFSSAVACTNCQTPRALFTDSALVLNALSISGTYARSSGRPSARKTFWIIGRYWPPRSRPSWMNERSLPWNSSM